MDKSITYCISQTLTEYYSSQIVDDFHQYLQEEEYDSDILDDDVKDTDPLFVDYIIHKNPATFHNEQQKVILTQRVKVATQNTDSIAAVRAQDYHWPCMHCTFINNSDSNICSMCYKTTHRGAPQLPFPLQFTDPKWSFLYAHMQTMYSDPQQYQIYHRIVVSIILQHQFEADTAEEDLHSLEDSIIADAIHTKFGWKCDDMRATHLIDGIKAALSTYNAPKPFLAIEQNMEHHNAAEDDGDDDDEDIYQVQDIGQLVDDGINSSEFWRLRLGHIMEFRHSRQNNAKLAQFDLLAQAMAVLGHRQVCCLLRLWIRERVRQREHHRPQQLIQFVKHGVDDASEFSEEQIAQMFKLGFHHKLMAHNSILRTLENEQPQPPQHRVHMKLIQIWLTAIVMKMNRYCANYAKFHCVFCLRFLPAPAMESESPLKQSLQLLQAIKDALQLLDEAEPVLTRDECWSFVIDLSQQKPAAEIVFESMDLYDDEQLTQRQYQQQYSKNQLYHLRRLDHVICKDNDNMCMALQISMHKYAENNCVSWLSYNRGHVPFFETDIATFIPQLFECTDTISDAEWNEIMATNEMIEIKSMDRMYSEMEQRFSHFIGT